MKIRLLEDFSNQIPDLVLTPADNATRTISNSNTPGIRALFGSVVTTFQSRSVYDRPGTVWYHRRPTVRMGIKNNSLNISVTVSTSNHTYNFGIRADWMMVFNLDSSWLDQRTIIRFDLTGTYPNLTLVSSLPSLARLSGLTNRPVSQIEMVYEDGRLRVFQDNKLVHNAVQDKAFGIGRLSTRADDPSGAMNFNISDLVVITVPVESPVRRLSNVRIERTYITEDDQGPVDLDDPINSNEPIGTQRRTVSRPVKFTPGTPVTLGEQERILGMESTLSVVSDTTERFTVRVSDGETELSEDVHEVDSTLQPRVTVGDYSLGDDPEDYDQVRIELSVEDLDETP